MQKLTYLALALAVIALAVSVTKPDNFGGFTTRGYQVNLLTHATSGPMIVSGNVQILATTTERAYASICNYGAGEAVLGLTNDKPIGNGNFVNTSVHLADNQCYEIAPINLYTGAIRASSTAESTLIIYEATATDL